MNPINKGWAKLPPYQVFHFYHAPQRGDTVQRAACNVPSLRAIPEHCFTDRDTLQPEQVCAKCTEFLANVDSLLAGLGQALSHGKRLPRCWVATALALACLWLTGCRDPLLLPATTTRPTATPRNLTPGPTPSATAEPTPTALIGEPQ